MRSQYPKIPPECQANGHVVGLPSRRQDGGSPYGVAAWWGEASRRAAREGRNLLRPNWRPQ